MKRLGTLLAAAAISATALTAPLATSVAGAQPAPAAASQAAQSQISPLEVTEDIGKSEWYKKYREDKRVLFVQATSPAMKDRKVPVAIIPAQQPQRPTIYLLNGAGSGEQNADWLTRSNVVDFYADKNVNVVIPMHGAFSYYTDWEQEPNSGYLHGPQKWETFLTKELPGPMEAKLSANGRRAIAGMSMSATSSLLLAQHNPGFYDAVGSYAGCAGTSTPLSYEFLRVTLNRSGATPEQMWGPMGSANNRHNDALVNAAKLRGTELYISSATGLAGETDTAGWLISQGYDPATALQGSATLQVEGGIIEAGVNYCTHLLKAKLDRDGIPATYNLRPTGTHSWPGWIEDLERSWPVFERAFNR